MIIIVIAMIVVRNYMCDYIWDLYIYSYIYIHIDIYFLPGELCLHIQVEDLKISADKSDEDMIIHMLYSIFFFFPIILLWLG